MSKNLKLIGILQDYLVPEEECNSVDFEVIYGRMTEEELIDEIIKRLKEML